MQINRGHLLISSCTYQTSLTQCIYRGDLYASVLLLRLHLRDDTYFRQSAGTHCNIQQVPWSTWFWLDRRGSQMERSVWL